MKRIIIILLLVALSVAVSCSRRVESSYDSLQFVDELVTDSLPGLQRIAKLAGDRSGVIALIGEPRHCLAISEKLLNVDDYDNVDAREVHDGLPDFSGETVVSILDYANAPYDSCLTSDGANCLLSALRRWPNTVVTTLAISSRGSAATCLSFIPRIRLFLIRQPATS